MKDDVEVIAFDLFGTLVQFGVRHRPYLKALKWAKEQGRTPESDDARVLMTNNLDPVDVLSLMGINLPGNMVDQLYSELDDEINKLSLFSDVVPTLDSLSGSGTPVIICSNLAKPYGVAIENLLSQYSLFKCLSYEIGAIKPEHKIYEAVLGCVNTTKDKIVFVGDTRLADYEGPLQFGFKAFHLERHSLIKMPGSINSLVDIFK